MKMTDDHSHWEPAHINGKDVVWEFIIDNMERPVIENPKHDYFATFSEVDGGLVIVRKGKFSLLIEGETDTAVIDVMNEITLGINENDNDDLYAATAHECYLDADVEKMAFSNIISFYHTDIK